MYSLIALKWEFILFIKNKKNEIEKILEYFIKKMILIKIIFNKKGN